MTEEQIEKIEEELYEETSYLIEIEEITNRNMIETHSSGYGMSFWFNDMFAWAMSWVTTFLPKEHKTVEELVSEFRKWYEESGKELNKRFDEVPYPDLKKKKPKVEEYFKANRIIGADLEKSINDFCGNEINTELQEWKEEENNK